jgi:hypothetical protein
LEIGETRIRGGLEKDPSRAKLWDELGQNVLCLLPSFRSAEIDVSDDTVSPRTQRANQVNKTTGVGKFGAVADGVGLEVVERL